MSLAIGPFETIVNIHFDSVTDTVTVVISSTASQPLDSQSVFINDSPPAIGSVVVRGKSKIKSSNTQTDIIEQINLPAYYPNGSYELWFLCSPTDFDPTPPQINRVNGFAIINTACYLVAPSGPYTSPFDPLFQQYLNNRQACVTALAGGFDLLALPQTVTFNGTRRNIITRTTTIVLSVFPTEKVQPGFSVTIAGGYVWDPPASVANFIVTPVSPPAPSGPIVNGSYPYTVQKVGTELIVRYSGA